MANAKKKKLTKVQAESDGTFLLKIAIYLVLGAFWIRLADPISLGSLTFHGVPIGLGLGLLIASHDHFKIDRKIEYVVLLISTLLSLFMPTGIII